MTEKRFVNVGNDIFQYGEWWCSANGEHCADVIATALNQLIEENEQLKEQIKELYKMVKYDVDNEIEVYPKTLAKYLVNILKIIGDVE